MKNEKKYDDLITRLKKLPQVEDSRGKEEIFARIERQMNRSSRKKMKRPSIFRRRMIPMFSALLVATILIILLPSMFNPDAPQTSKGINDQPHKYPSVTSADESSETGIDQAEDIPSDKSLETHDSVLFNDYEKLTLQQAPESSVVVYGAVTEEQLQYFIPITFFIEGEENLNEAYNELDNYIEEENWGVSHSILEGITYDLSQEHQEVIIHFPEDYSLANGSARLNAFSEMMALMFTPYRIDHAIFQADGDGMIDLGNFGEIEGTPIQDPHPVNYKLYKHPDASRSFLVPSKMYEQTLTEALADMKNDDDFYHITETIPEDLPFIAEIEEQELTFIITDDHSLADEQEYITMIEAILMTAKSYDLTYVSFENTGVEKVGPYDVTDAIEVPEFINPIVIREE